ncbi:sugar ABC transporter ATP-binding protein [Ligilactobacillus aviarius]|uniref:Sugar ABC transporter ATP-binding protein n=2 Tax=Ligilactobacillus aviarius TaxID=1606 RepID=A0A179CNS3_9LACO|nr:sugar ABC transporter ATP-binding protein [Ligilactobacillus aviarius]OAP99136.1 sugar ABC transporter ATP-binding protein [Ligilactobacillus aviarius]OAQ02674.1 sugar ABC transporter ATP-binding protein [Ligilactobacillus aviarius]OAQ06708.1 sugar ABC transporter ATP-binding protein [Ligilactobacillus aviarius]OAS75361.1 sugar ABC transporter ATP-binding protein [Ligilactobacillus aviarius]
MIDNHYILWILADPRKGENKRMIEVSNLNKTYENGYEALKNVNFSVEKGELVCLLGPSGCGKSTLLNIISGLLDATSGDVKFEGKSVLDVAPENRDIGFVFQNYALFPHMTAEENVMFPLTVGKNKKTKAEAREIAQKYMELTHITDIAKKKPGQLSGGQQQRVAIARALVQQPKVLLMDEPLSNLDARLRLQIREEIRALVKEVGITTIFVTHDQEEALSIGDRIILLNNGVVQQADKGQNLYLDPANQFVANFIGNPVIDLFDVQFDGNQFNNEHFNLLAERLTDSKLKQKLTAGDYVIGIRPENLQPSTAEMADFTIKVDDIELIGRERILKFYFGDKQYRSLVDIEDQIGAADEVNLRFDMKKAFIFNKDGERVY